MIYKKIGDIVGTDKEVKAQNGNWVSRRMLLKADGMGFSFHETIIFPETETHIWYKNHLEAVYCVAGSGELETLNDGKKYLLEPGVMYALNQHDEHLLRCFEEMRLICVFNPALRGDEVHDENGVYPAYD
ncbi:MAG TPA: ectoine synthase [Deltaproteobacteria bacterium]|nr:ectoine synthase [Deltaproteobacteria bacterium]